MSFLKKTLFDLRLPEEKDIVRKQLEDLQKNKFNSFEARHIKKDGSIFYVDVRAKYFHAQGVTYIHSLVRDITARKQVEEKLRWRENQVSQLLQNTDQGIYGIDKDGQCVFINNSGMRMLGYTRDECMGKNMHHLIHHSFADGTHYPVEDCPIFRAKGQRSRRTNQ